MWSFLSGYTLKEYRWGLLWPLANCLFCVLNLCSVILDATLIYQLLFVLNCVNLLQHHSTCRLCAVLTLSLAAYGQAHFSLAVVPTALVINVVFLLYALFVLFFFRQEFRDEADVA